jgi:hypothetical protein
MQSLSSIHRQLIVRYLSPLEQIPLQTLSHVWYDTLHSHYELWSTYQRKPQLEEEEYPFSLLSQDILAELDNETLVTATGDVHLSCSQKRLKRRSQKKHDTTTNSNSCLVPNVKSVVFSSYGMHFTVSDSRYISSVTKLTIAESKVLKESSIIRLPHVNENDEDEDEEKERILPEFCTLLEIGAQSDLPFVYGLYWDDIDDTLVLLQCRFSQGTWLERKQVMDANYSSCDWLFVRPSCVLIVSSQRETNEFRLILVQHDDLSVRYFRMFRWSHVFPEASLALPDYAWDELDVAFSSTGYLLVKRRLNLHFIEAFHIFYGDAAVRLPFTIPALHDHWEAGRDRSFGVGLSKIYFRNGSHLVSAGVKTRVV